MKKLSLGLIMSIIGSCLFGVIIIVSFLPSGIFSGHDIFLHLIYVQKFSQSLSTGQFPVRIIDWIFPGFDQPLFTFYQPGIYYLLTLFKFVGFSTVASIKIFSALVWMGSGVFMFLFVKRRFTLVPAVVSALLYTFGPYHIVDIFVRAALPEFTALAIVPAVFWSIDGMLFTKNKTYVWLVPFFLFLLLIIHPPTFLMFLFLFVCYILFQMQYKDRLRYVLIFIVLTIFSIGMASFFLLPAFFEKSFVHVQEAAMGKYDFHKHFVCVPQFFSTDWGYGFSDIGCNDTMSFGLGTINTLFIAASLVLLVVSYFKRKKIRILSLFLCFFSISIFMMLPASKIVWEHTPYLAYFQFPWRFLALSLFTSSFLAGYVCSVLRSKYQLYTYVAVCAFILFLYIPYLHPQQFYPQKDLTFDQSAFTTDEQYVNKKHVPEPFYDPTSMQKIASPQTIPTDEIAFSFNTNVSVLEQAAYSKKYAIEGRSQTATIYVRSLQNWIITIDGRKTPVTVDSFGYISFQLPAGKHIVEALFTETVVEKCADVISLLFLLVFFASGIYVYMKKQQ